MTSDDTAKNTHLEEALQLFQSANARSHSPSGTQSSLSVRIAAIFLMLSRTAEAEAVARSVKASLAAEYPGHVTPPISADLEALVSAHIILREYDSALQSFQRFAKR